MGALRRITARFGSTHEWLRDDWPCLSAGPRGVPQLLVHALASAPPPDARPPVVWAMAAAAGLTLLRVAPAAAAGRKMDAALAWTFVS